MKRGLLRPVPFGTWLAMTNICLSKQTFELNWILHQGVGLLLRGILFGPLLFQSAIGSHSFEAHEESEGEEHKIDDGQQCLPVAEKTDTCIDQSS